MKCKKQVLITNIKVGFKVDEDNVRRNEFCGKKVIQNATWHRVAINKILNETYLQ